MAGDYTGAMATLQPILPPGTHDALRKIEDRCKERGITFDDLMPPPAELSLPDDLALKHREWF